MIAAVLTVAIGAAVCPVQATLSKGLPIALETVDAMSSKTAHKGDMVALVTSEDVSVDGNVVIPKGSAARGQVADARATGGLGVNGRLVIHPLYLTRGDTTVRLAGSLMQKRDTPAGSVIGLVAVSPLFSGGDVRLPARSSISAQVDKSVQIDICPAMQRKP